MLMLYVAGVGLFSAIRAQSSYIRTYVHSTPINSCGRKILQIIAHGSSDTLRYVVVALNMDRSVLLSPKRYNDLTASCNIIRVEKCEGKAVVGALSSTNDQHVRPSPCSVYLHYIRTCCNVPWNQIRARCNRSWTRSLPSRL